MKTMYVQNVICISRLIPCFTLFPIYSKGTPVYPCNFINEIVLVRITSDNCESTLWSFSVTTILKMCWEFWEKNHGSVVRPNALLYPYLCFSLFWVTWFVLCLISWDKYKNMVQTSIAKKPFPVNYITYWVWLTNYYVPNYNDW